MSSDHTATLGRVPLFASLDESDLGRVAALATEFDAKAGHVLIETGHPGNGLFVIEEGTVQVDLPDGSHIERGPGEFVGELAVLADTPRVARVSASTDLRCLAISRADLLNLLEERGDIALAMLREVATRLAQATSG